MTNDQCGNGRCYNDCLKSTEKRGIQNTKDAMLARSLYLSCAPAVSCGELAAWGSGGDAEGQQERDPGLRQRRLRHMHISHTCLTITLDNLGNPSVISNSISNTQAVVLDERAISHSLTLLSSSCFSSSTGSHLGVIRIATEQRQRKTVIS